ncbi:MAG: hypothetical protein CMK59_11005 [Proteobacteria bacterium]|nr:hypothetical protein [Pseudomonadota bacterium]
MNGVFFLIVCGCKTAVQEYTKTIGSSSEGSDTETIQVEDTAAEELNLYPELLMEESDGYEEWLTEAQNIGWEYLMALHTCDTNIECGNPMNHKVRIAGSQDSYDWVFLSEFPEVPGSVPDLVFRQGTLYLYAMHFRYRYNFEEGEWSEPTDVSVLNAAGELDRHVDPNPVLAEDGRIVLLYLNNDQNGDPASCVEFPCVKSFRMAVEKNGSDGTEFELAQELISVELSQEQRIAADPDLFIGPDGYYIYLSRGQAIEVHKSTSLWGPYEPAYELPDHRITRNGGGVPAGYYDWNTSMFWTFSTKHLDSTAFTDIRMVRHSSFEHQDEAEFESLGLLNFLEEGNLVSSPGLMVFKSSF